MNVEEDAEKDAEEDAEYYTAGDAEDDADGGAAIETEGAAAEAEGGDGTWTRRNTRELCVVSSSVKLRTVFRDSLNHTKSLSPPHRYGIFETSLDCRSPCNPPQQTPACLQWMVFCDVV